MKTVSFRLPDALHARAKTEAAHIGISLNALLIISLRAYLDQNFSQPEPAPPHNDDWLKAELQRQNDFLQGLQDAYADD